MNLQKELRITEIFYSIQGESTFVGLPTAFIRLTGCPLRCNYCDTSYAFHGGIKLSLQDILRKVEEYQPRYVTVTGGEPLAQPHCFDLLTELCDHDYIVSLETSGALDITKVDSRVIIVMDLKTPDSGEVDKNLYANIQHLKATDQIKFVICTRTDYDWAKNIMHEFNLIDRYQILFSPSFSQLDPKDLAQWILQDNLPVRLQLQIHKYIWGEIAGV